MSGVSTTVKVVGFLLALGVAFAASWGVGSAVGPRDVEPTATHGGGGHDEGGSDDGAHAEGGHEAQGSGEAAHLPGGLAVSQDGYTLALEQTSVAPGRREVGFTITGPDGRPQTAYEVEHEKELHLIAVRRDLTGFQHVHPERDAGGRWSVRLDLRPGSWRLYADFAPTGGEGLTLGADLDVAGEYEPAAPPADRRTAEVDGYEVALEGDAAPGEATTLTARVTRDGEDVTDLQPYLGAYGHLVALREGDLAYLHVHPQDGPAGPDVAFDTTLPTEGGYRLFLDFKHEGVVRTASFVVRTEGGPAVASDQDGQDPQGEQDEHAEEGEDHDH